MTIPNVIQLTVVFQDPFSLKGLYKLIFWWLIDHGYVNNAQAGDIDATDEKDLEIFYSEIVRAGGVTEFEFWWRAEKGTKGTRGTRDPYFRYKISVDYLGLAIRDTEVVKDNKKYKVQIGEITIRLMGELIIKHNNNKAWENNLILKYFKNWWNEKAYAEKTESEEDFVIEDVTNLQKTIKEFLELRQYEPVEDLFFEKKGFE